MMEVWDAPHIGVDGISDEVTALPQDGGPSDYQDRYFDSFATAYDESRIRAYAEKVLSDVVFFSFSLDTV